MSKVCAPLICTDSNRWYFWSTSSTAGRNAATMTTFRHHDESGQPASIAWIVKTKLKENSSNKNYNIFPTAVRSRLFSYHLNVHLYVEAIIVEVVLVSPSSSPCYVLHYIVYDHTIIPCSKYDCCTKKSTRSQCRFFCGTIILEKKKLPKIFKNYLG